MSNKLKIALVLILLGLIGVMSLLTINFSMDQLPPEIVKQFSPQVIQLLVLMNPTILVVIGVAVGVALYDKVLLKLPLISSILGIESSNISIKQQLIWGIVYGFLVGICTTSIGLIFKNAIPDEFAIASNNIQTTVLARVLYGGIAEELMMRFGFMTFVVWIVFKLTKSLRPSTYWIGIVLSTLLFALGHFPVVFTTIGSPSLQFLTYILIGNSVAGLFFGHLYWKKGLEAAIFSHMFAHVTMLLLERMTA